MQFRIHLFLEFFILPLFFLSGCGFSADTHTGQPSDHGNGLQAEGWAPSIPNLDSGPEMAFSPQIAVEGDPANNGVGDDNQSSAIAVWVKLEDPDPFDSNPQQVYRLYAAYFNGATGWGAPQVIDAGSADYLSAGAPKVSMDDIGNAVVVWQQSDGTTQRVYALRFSGGAWAGAPEVLDSGGGAASPSIAVEPDGGGTAMAVYARQVNGVFRVYARQLTGGIAGGSWGPEKNIDKPSCCSLSIAVDTTTFVGGGVPQGTSTVIDNFGNIHYVYYNGGFRDLRYGLNLDTVCVDGGGGGCDVVSGTAPIVGWYPAMAVDRATGQVHIAYYDQTNANLRYATCATDCLNHTNWTTICVDGGAGCEGTTVAIVGSLHTSIAVDGTGRVHIAYYNQSNSNLKYATCAGSCTTAGSWAGNIICVDGGAGCAGTTNAAVGQSNSIAVDATGRVHISYNDVGANHLKYATCAGSCGTQANWVGNIICVDGGAGCAGTTVASVGQDTSIAVDGTGRVYISYYDTTNTNLKYATCAGSCLDVTATGGWSSTGGGAIVCVDGGAGCAGTANFNVGEYSSISVDGTGRVHIAYYDTSHTDLKYATCAGDGSDADAIPCNDVSASGEWTSSQGGEIVCVEGSMAGCRRSNANAVGENSSIGTDPTEGTVAIVFVDATAGDLKLTANLARSADSPVVAMDTSGRAIAAFTRQIATLCYVPPTVDVGVSNASRAITLAPVLCYDSSLLVNRFSGTSWGSALEIDPDAPMSNGANATICFQAGNAANVTGNLTGFSVACQDVSQPRIAMDRAGNATVVVKAYWAEMEDGANNSFLGGTCSDGAAATQNGNFCDSPNDHSTNGAPSGSVSDEWNGNAIAARRFDQGTGTWGGAVFLYAHSNQPSNATTAGGSERFYNCPAAGRAQVDTGRWLIECQLNAPMIAIGDTDNNPATNTDMALAVHERFDGTNYDVYADCFTQTSLNTCGGAAATGWRSSFAIPAPGTATNDNYTTPYFVLNDTTVSRQAFSPQVAVDSTGNGLAVWTERDGNQWRVYGMRFVAGTGFDTATRVPIDAIAFGPDTSCTSGNCFYANPVLGMEWVNAGNAASCPSAVSCGSAWTLMLDMELSGGALLPPILNARVQSHQWTPP